MTDHSDAFAPIDPNTELAQPTPANFEESTVDFISPVPQNVESPAAAAARIFRRPPNDHWRYRDQDRNTVFVVVRWDTVGSDGNPDKEIRPLCYVRSADDTEHWKFTAYPAPRPLYNLHRIAEAATAPIVIVEGERCADAAVDVFPDYIPTTSAGGALSADKSDWSVLRGRPEVVIWPDADQPGSNYAEAVAQIAYDLGVRTIRIVDVDKLAHQSRTRYQRTPVLGWDVVNALKDGWSPSELGHAALASARVWKAAPKTTWPDGYQMMENGLQKEVRVKGEAEPQYIQLTGPFEVIGEGRDDRGAGRGVVLAWKDPDSREQREFVKKSDLVGDGVEWYKPLADRGFPGPSRRIDIRCLAEGIHKCRSSRRIIRVRRTGWHGSSFVLPHRTIGNTGSDTIHFEGSLSANVRYAERGTLEEWKEFIAKPANGNSRLIFNISAAGAGPIIDALEESSFGFNSEGPSSTGKSAALIAAGSVWGGGGVLGYCHAYRTTDNGAEGIFAAHSGTAICFDELGQLPPEIAGQFSYQFGNGTGKIRANRNGDARPPVQWRAIMLSTGEVGFAGKLEESGRKQKLKAGQSVRIIDIPCDAGKGLGIFEDCHGLAAADFASKLKVDAMSYYGFAGPALVEYLACRLALDLEGTNAELRERINGAQRCLIAQVANPDGQVSRVARSFAIVAVAGDLMREALRLPWDIGAPMQAAERCFAAWIESRGGNDSHEIMSAISALRECVEAHGQSRFLNLQNTTDDEDFALEVEEGATVHDAFGYQYAHGGGAIWGFTTTGLKNAMRGCGGFKLLVMQLAERGVIQKGRGRIQTERKIGGRKVRFYAIPHDKLFEE